MEFYFCEVCGKRLTEEDLNSGEARNKQVKGIYCKDCSDGVRTLEFEAIQQVKVQSANQENTDQPNAKRASNGLASSHTWSREASTSRRADYRQDRAWKGRSKSAVTSLFIGLTVFSFGLLFVFSSSSDKRQIRVRQTENPSSRSRIEVEPHLKDQELEASVPRIPRESIPTSPSREISITSDGRSIEGALVTQNNIASEKTVSEVASKSQTSLSGLVAWWAFDEDSGDKIFDSSGFSRHGTLQNGSERCKGIKGGGVQFDGTKGSIVAENVGVNTQDGGSNTVAFWMKWNGTNNQMPFGWNGLYDLWLYGDSFGVNTGQINILGIASAGLSGRWVHVAAVFPNGVPSASNVKLYIDGVEQTVSQRLGSTTASRKATPKIFVSGWGYDGGLKFGGCIDDVRIYNRELSAAEVVDLIGNADTLLR